MTGRLSPLPPQELAARLIVPLAALAAAAVFAAGQTDPSAATETAFLGLLAAAVLLPVAALAPAPARELWLGAPLAVAALWALPAGPGRGLATVAVCAAALAAAAARRLARPVGSDGSDGSDGSGGSGGSGRAGPAGRAGGWAAAFSTLLPLCLGFQLLARGERLLAPELSPAAVAELAVALVGLPAVAAAALAVLARRAGTGRALIAAAAVAAPVPGFNVAATLALAALAAAAELAAEPALPARPGDQTGSGADAIPTRRSPAGAGRAIRGVPPGWTHTSALPPSRVTLALAVLVVAAPLLWEPRAALVAAAAALVAFSRLARRSWAARAGGVLAVVAAVVAPLAGWTLAGARLAWLPILLPALPAALAWRWLAGGSRTGGPGGTKATGGGAAVAASPAEQATAATADVPGPAASQTASGPGASVHRPLERPLGDHTAGAALSAGPPASSVSSPYPASASPASGAAAVRPTSHPASASKPAASPGARPSAPGADDRPGLGVLVAFALVAVAAARTVPGPAALAAPAALGALLVPRRSPLGGIQGLWSAALAGGAALLAAYPWLREAPAADALAMIGLAPGWRAAAILAVAAPLPALAARLTAGGARPPISLPTSPGGELVSGARRLSAAPAAGWAAALLAAAVAVPLAAPGREVELGGEVALDAAQRRFTALLAGPRVGSVVLDTSLANAAALPAGTGVATVRLVGLPAGGTGAIAPSAATPGAESAGEPPATGPGSGAARGRVSPPGEDGQQHLPPPGGAGSWTLAVGRDTGEWAARRRDVAARYAVPAPAAWVARIEVDTEGRPFFARRYRTRLELTDGRLYASALVIERRPGLDGVVLRLHRLEVRR